MTRDTNTTDTDTAVRGVDWSLVARLVVPVVGGTTTAGGAVVALALAVPAWGLALAVAVTATAVGATAGAALQATDEARQAPAGVRAVRLALEASRTDETNGGTR